WSRCSDHSAGTGPGLREGRPRLRREPRDARYACFPCTNSSLMSMNDGLPRFVFMVSLMNRTPVFPADGVSVWNTPCESAAVLFKATIHADVAGVRAEV